MERIVIKVGSNVLTREDGTLDRTRMSSIVDQTYELRQHGYEIILVTSGAVACGRSMLKTPAPLDAVEQRQLYSAMGQVRLMHWYYELFRDYKIRTGQVLTTKESFSTEEQYQNQKSCMEVMLQNGVIPIVNENDTVCITELMFTDNDELAGLVAAMMGASTLIILSNIDGLYDGDPESDSAKVIRTVHPNDDPTTFITNKKSSLGRGGMTSKCTTAMKAAKQGIRVLLANGKRENILADLMLHAEDTVHTEFLPDKAK